MNNIRQIQELNRRELENGVSPDASWHADYRDTAYIYIGGLPFELSEGDIMTIFSQFGEPTYVNLIRDKESGKSRGFAFLKYEDQRSTDLAVDNLGGTTILNRMIRVDHTRYKKQDDETQEGQMEPRSNNTAGVVAEGRERNSQTDVLDGGFETRTPFLKEERELALLMKNHDDDDPMKAFLIQEKRDEITAARAALGDRGVFRKGEKIKHRHHHRRHHSHRSRSADGREGSKHRGGRDRDRS